MLLIDEAEEQHELAEEQETRRLRRIQQNPSEGLWPYAHFVLQVHLVEFLHSLHWAIMYSCGNFGRFYRTIVMKVAYGVLTREHDFFIRLKWNHVSSVCSVWVEATCIEPYLLFFFSSHSRQTCPKVSFIHHPGLCPETHKHVCSSMGNSQVIWLFDSSCRALVGKHGKVICDISSTDNMHHVWKSLE